LFFGDLREKGTVMACHYLHCEDDEQAKAQADELAVANPVELWDPPVRIARFEPKQ
jgi:hypothetical protein